MPDYFLPDAPMESSPEIHAPLAPRLVRWPLWVWALQLLPSSLLIALAVWRMKSGDAFNVDWRTWLGFVIGLAWTASAAASLFFQSTRIWLAKNWPKWCLSAVSILVIAVMMDVVFTASGMVPTLSRQRSRSIKYAHDGMTATRLIPQEIVRDDGERIEINQRGFRGKEINAVKEPSILRIVIAGGSQVFDYQGGGWPGLVGSELERRGYDVEVINVGVPGHNSVDSLAKLIGDVWTLSPDIVFVCHTWNDIKFFSRLTPQSPYRELPPPESVTWEKDWRLFPEGLDRWLTVSSIYRLCRVTLIELMFSEEGRLTQTTQHEALSSESLGVRQFALNLRLIHALTQQIGAEMVVAKQAYLESGVGTSGKRVEQYAQRNLLMTLAQRDKCYQLCNEVIDRLAGDGVEVVDMHAALGSKPEYFYDGIHFSPAGSQAVSLVVADVLEDNLQRLRDGGSAGQPLQPPTIDGGRCARAVADRERRGRYPITVGPNSSTCCGPSLTGGVRVGNRLVRNHRSQQEARRSCGSLLATSCILPRRVRSSSLPSGSTSCTIQYFSTS